VTEEEEEEENDDIGQQNTTLMETNVVTAMQLNNILYKSEHHELSMQGVSKIGTIAVQFLILRRFFDE